MELFLGEEEAHIVNAAGHQKPESERLPKRKNN